MFDFTYIGILPMKKPAGLFFSLLTSILMLFSSSKISSFHIAKAFEKSTMISFSEIFGRLDKVIGFIWEVFPLPYFKLAILTCFKYLARAIGAFKNPLMQLVKKRSEERRVGKKSKTQMKQNHRSRKDK